jgi:hypothetical protein
MTEEKIQEIKTLPNYVIEVKQDRYGEWICSKLRVQGDTVREINIRIKAAKKAVTTQLKGLNK